MVEVTNLPRELVWQQDKPKRKNDAQSAGDEDRPTKHAKHSGGQFKASKKGREQAESEEIDTEGVRVEGQMRRGRKQGE